ncbi:hypothetical protein FisN_1Lh462 [Fistulifera solaris]|uniref:Metallo-beta-lactamase domain-containing protein n=1 Tax=Fistulifera solaris TaxID=1519565 RepID=A0A1Z5K1D7_FISSO|nr:hypothetical protein FisN_1Lh462 [Fistulifera solaris]|eukprot:GAX20057.1 hypothetical protein FisN_1Lh462 [Fistulifera solaris]
MHVRAASIHFLFVVQWIDIAFSFTISSRKGPTRLTFCELAANDQVTWPFGEPSNTEETEQRGDFHIPNTGVSVSDEIENSAKDRFVTEVVPIKGLTGVAQLVTTAVHTGSFEPVRYLVPLSPLRKTKEDEGDKSVYEARYAMIDIPPYSPQLLGQIQSFLGKKSTLALALITNRDAIHYDSAPAIYSARRSVLKLWKEALPDLEVVAYRLDIPRECRRFVTQILDGYGPFGLKDTIEVEAFFNASFVELGRPLTVEEWDDDLAESILSGQTEADEEAEMNENESLSPENIRLKEDAMDIVALYTPGHSFGSMSYLFPSQKLCFAGYTIPVEDTRIEENMGIGGAGPALDCRGYISTNKGGIGRQMESAVSLVQNYADRFKVVLPARGDPLFLDGDHEERKRDLLEILDQYKMIGEIYERLGILNDGDSG